VYALPVFDDKEEAVVGVITLYQAQEGAAEDKMVTDAMAPVRCTLHTGDLLEEAAALMYENDLLLVPVQNASGQFAGILAQSSLVEAVLELTGARHGGTRVTLVSPDVLGRAEKIGRVARLHKMNISHFFSKKDSLVGQVIVIKVDSHDVDGFVHGLEEENFKILDIRRLGKGR